MPVKVALAEVRKAYNIPEAAPIVSVSEVNASIDRALRNRPELTDILVVGEVTDIFQREQMRTVFFSLKDEHGRIRCALSRSVKLGFELANGAQVLVSGSVGVYAPRGEYSIEARAVFPLGEGMLALRHQKLKEKLGKEGLFDPARKRPLPPLPACIGILSSKAGKGFRDALTTVRRRFPSVHVAYIACFVQGERALESIAAGLRALNQRRVDVILLVRGGGAAEDPSAYNDERTVRALVASKAPVVTGIGHVADETLCDLAADVREATPTAAAERACPKLQDLAGRVERAQEALERAHANFVSGKKKDEKLAGYEHKVKEAEKVMEGRDTTVARYRFAIGVFIVLLLLALAAILVLSGGGP